LKVEVSTITADPNGWQQTLSFVHKGRVRIEIFCGRTKTELTRHVDERIAELKRMKE